MTLNLSPEWRVLIRSQPMGLAEAGEIHVTMPEPVDQFGDEEFTFLMAALYRRGSASRTTPARTLNQVSVRP